MTQVGKIGTLKELGVMPGDKVKCVDQGSPYEGHTYTICEEHPILDVGQCAYRDSGDGLGYVTMNCDWKFLLVSRAADTSTLWHDMTPEQRAAVPQSVLDDPHNPLQIPWGEWSWSAKGAVLLAHHEGRVIEWASKGSGFSKDQAWTWQHCPNAVGKFDAYAYRVQPEPQRVDLLADGVKVGTVAMRDGKADPDSVEWEA